MAYSLGAQAGRALYAPRRQTHSLGLKSDEPLGFTQSTAYHAAARLQNRRFNQAPPHDRDKRMQGRCSNKCNMKFESFWITAAVDAFLQAVCGHYAHKDVRTCAFVHPFAIPEDIDHE